MLRSCHKGSATLRRVAVIAALSTAAHAEFLFGAAVGQAAETPPEPSEDSFSVRVDPGEHTGTVTSVATTPRGEYVVTASVDRTARVWDGTTGELLRTLRPPSQAAGAEGRLFAVAISPDATLVAAGGVTRFFENAEDRSSAVYLFDRASGALVRSLHGFPGSSSEEQLTRLSFSPDGRRLVAVHSKAPTAVFEVASGRALSANLDPQREIIDADFDPSGRLLLTQSGGLLRILDRELRPGAQAVMDERRPLGARFSPDGSQVAVLYPQGPRLELRDGRDLRRRTDVSGSDLDSVQLTSLAFSRDGKNLYAAGRGQPDGLGTIWRWPLAKGGASKAELQVAQGLPLALAARPAGGVLFAADDPSWGAVDAADKSVFTSGGRHPLAAQPEALLVDATGERIEFLPSSGSREPVRFQLSELRLLRAPPADSALRPPRSQLPGHEVTGWRSEGRVRFDGVVLTLPSERGAALALSPSGRSFVLGTNYRLTRYMVDKTDREGCPLPAGEGFAPPCARAVVELSLIHI